MRVLLIRYHDRGNVNTRLPQSLNRRQGVLPPLGIAYLAAVLEMNGHKVDILDAQALNLSPNEVREKILGVRPAIVGITSMTPSFLGALEAAHLAKECGAWVVMGGPHLAIFPRETLSYPCIDFGVLGEGEYTLLELIQALEGQKAFSAIKGLVYKEGDQVHVNEARIVEDLDELPHPAFHLLPMAHYSSIIGLKPVTTMISSRGCPHRCGFCFKSPSDRKYRVRSPKDVVDEMEDLVRRYKVKEVMFYDDVMTLDRDRVGTICGEILRRDLKVRWETPTRIDAVDPGMLHLMHRAGCIRLRYGIESGDPKILELMGKKISLDRARQVFRWTKEAHIEAFAYFMIGYAQETKETIERTISLAMELNPDLVMFTAVTPLPETPLYQRAKEEGLFEGDYWRDFTLKLRRDPIPYFFPGTERYVKRAYRSFYLRAPYILRRLRKVRSFHDLKMHWDAALGIFFFNMRDGSRTSFHVKRHHSF